MPDIVATATDGSDLFAASPASGVRQFSWSPKAKSLAGLHGWLKGTLVAYGVAELGFALLAAINLWLFNALENGAELSDLQFTLLDLLLGYGGLITAVVGIVLMVLVAIAYCRFVFRANKNLQVSNARGDLMGPGWAVAYNFIPIMNIWKPHQAMRQIWRSSSDPEHGRHDPPGAMWSWWLLWLVSNWISTISFRLAVSAGAFADEITDFDLYKFTFWLDIASSVCMIASILFLLSILREIAWAQAKLAGEAHNEGA